MNLLVNNLTYWLLDENIIDKNDIEIYKYGIQQGFFSIINSVITLIMGVLLGVFGQSIVLLLSYLPLRMYAGGAHARTAFCCFLYTQSINFSLLLVIKWLKTPNVAVLVLTIFAMLIIYKFSPVETENKPLSDEEIQLYGNKAKKILAALFCIAISLYFVGFDKYTLCILGTIIMTATIMAFGLFKNKKNSW